MKKGNFYEFIINNDNTIDNSSYKLIKSKNNLSVDEYYFIKNNDYKYIIKKY